MTQKISIPKVVGLVLGIVVFFIFCFAHVEGLSPAATKGLGLILMSGIFWIFEALPYHVTGLITLCLFVALRIVEFPVAFRGFGEAATWMLIFSFLLAKGFQVSGLGKRVGLILLTMFKKLSFGKLLITFIALVFIGNLFVPSVAAYVVVVLGLIQGVVSAFGLPPDKRTELSAALSCFPGILGLINGKNFISGVIGNSVISGIISGQYGVTISYTQWLVTWLVMIPIPLIATFLFLRKIYKPEVNFDDPHLREQFLEEKKALGPMGRKEIEAAILFVVVLVLWITHWGGFSVQLATGLVAMIMVLPRVGILEYDDFATINYPIFIFLGTCTCVGQILTALEIDSWVAGKLGGFAVFNSSSKFVIATTFFLIIVVTHLVMESLCQINFFLPVLIKMNVVPIEQAAVIMSAGTHVYQFPFQAAPIAVSMGYGLCKGSDIAKYGVFISIICVIQTIVGFALGWPVVPGF